MKNWWTDEELLQALYLTDHHGLSRSQVGQRMGRTKRSVIGALCRITNDTDASDPDGNQNGTMDPLWWKR